MTRSEKSAGARWWQPATIGIALGLVAGVLIAWTDIAEEMDLVPLVAICILIGAVLGAVIGFTVKILQHR